MKKVVKEDSIITIILNRDYSKLTDRQLVVLANYPKIFGLGKDYVKLLPNKDGSFTNETKEKALKYIETNILPREEILNRIDGETIHDNDIEVCFKENFINSLRKLNLFQLGFFLDMVGHYMTGKGHRCNFFGNYFEMLKTYHEINSIISSAFGSNLAFQFFYKGVSKNFYENGSFYYIDGEDDKRWPRINRQELIDLLEKKCVHYFYILEIIASKALEISAEECLQNHKDPLPLKSVSARARLYFNIIEERRVKVKSEDSKNVSQQTWSIIVDEYSNKKDLEESDEKDCI